MSFTADPYLSRLKPFQRATVEHVFDRMFGADPVHRFLVADEVGLGKTMVARGLVAKLIEHYSDTEPERRIDVLYVCSNQAIAKQNFSKIAVVGNQRHAVTDRITKLPLHVHDLQRTQPDVGMAVNFIPITPTTSLDLRSNVGRADERALLHVLLSDERLLGRKFMRRMGAERVLRQNAGDERWTWEKHIVLRSPVDPSLLDRFVQDVSTSQDGEAPLADQFAAAADLFRRRQQWDDPRLRSERTSIVGRLRRQLAKTCIEALEPDLIILDEFQRFPKLLDPNEPVGELAELLFGCEDAKTLLLSATPYRMLTRAAEIDEDHHTDFVKTTKFLLEHDEAEVAALTETLHVYRAGLRGLASGGVDDVRQARDELTRRLARVMARTERLAATTDRSGMLEAKPRDAITPRLEPSDLAAFKELDGVATQLKNHDVVEYWKSAPYPLNFMDDYKLAQDFERALARGEVGAIKHGLNADAIRAMKPIDLGNARLRGLVEKLDEEKAWPLLWLPASLPYYTAGRPFDQATIATKRLVFSAWTVVPKAIAALTSYEAERRVFGKLPGRKRPEIQALQWRAGGPMTELVLSLPSLSLARLADPRALAAEMGGGDGPVDRPKLIRAAEKRLRNALKPLKTTNVGREDLRWYAVAPLLLDERLEDGAVRAWLETAAASEQDAFAWAHHRRRLIDLVDDPSQLGRMPDDLGTVLAKVAIAGPGTAALRALMHLSSDMQPSELLARAFKVGMAFRALFNLPEAYAIVRSLSETRFADDVFWKAALDYCVAGNLQAVLDEYVHVLGDWVEDRPRESGGKVGAIVDTATEAIGIHTADLTARTIEDGHIGEPLRMRSRFALRLGDGRSEDGKSVQRVDSVRKAFNSPFWPFVLATTSVGQEGLDFHLYSHAVVHWNLPSNPVDLEQREGRVHRFKGHAVRRNLAARYRADGVTAQGEPWATMFETAQPGDEGLQPYWVFEGHARIERHALVLPMSRDAQRLEELVRLLGIYRLAFGQPRQDELLAALRRVPDIESHVSELLIDLRPPAAALVPR